MTWSWIAHGVQSYGYYAVFALIAAESMGLPLPGETALITAALYAGQTHRLSVVALAAVAAAGAIAGDNAGYWLGRTGGYRLAERYGRFIHLDQARLRLGRHLFARHGVKVVFFGRFVAVLRTFAAFFAGVTGMRWPGFLAANAAGGVAWASFYAFGAYALGGAAHSVGTMITYVGYGVASAATIASIVWVRRSLRRELLLEEVAGSPQTGRGEDARPPSRSPGFRHGHDAGNTADGGAVQPGVCHRDGRAHQALC